jgi:hypothetical protein
MALSQREVSMINHRAPGGGNGARDLEPATSEMLKLLPLNHITVESTMSILKYPSRHEFLSKIDNLCLKTYLLMDYLVEMRG